MMHRARFVQIEINLQTVLSGARHQRAQSRNPLLTPLAELREGGIFRQRAQHRVDPHAVHAGSRETLQKALGVGGDLWVGERVAILGKVRKNKTQTERRGVRRRDDGDAGIRPRKAVDKGEARLFGLEQAVRETLLTQPGGEPSGCRAFGLGGLRVTQRRAGGLDAAKLDEEEIVFHQGIAQPLAREARERQELVIGQQVPVAPHHSDIALVLPRRQDRALRRQAHGGRNLRHVLGRRAQNLGQPCLRHHTPVAPHNLMQPVRERFAPQRGFFAVLIRQRRFRAAHGACRDECHRHESRHRPSYHGTPPVPFSESGSVSHTRHVLTTLLAHGRSVGADVS
ncbi:MAG: hypothetical protein BWY57_02020 [Betaproteobacteria bacterium ADurb.Bin341]|nr:MAG: hypothetical protein BWY57_02020 [Betaproteobacteria bacterium ADurb.Bin341]